ncbi:hypothetical protein ACFWHW_04690 [Streptomyces pharetrae]|uniref:hypothetical protein n=1 Tax=Streptomyces pharetrae TaxID=291370 RepID=UPI00365AEC82
MAYRSTARVACGLDDPDRDDCLMAGVAESDGEEAFSLLFMCDVAEPDEQEVRLGMDTHCLVTPTRAPRTAVCGKWRWTVRCCG